MSSFAREIPTIYTARIRAFDEKLAAFPYALPVHGGFALGPRGPGGVPKAVAEWAHENRIEVWRLSSEVRFKTENDALMFKLFWGDEYLETC
ncbi:hypothetical protein [Methylobacterium nodulans]|uniref:Uncharacterized protein n=1 Tax=Methylobacterium nodulans (strain LMG 21967 / CNCM I-2342 / ORS 2060) TaxID=460265 RepID=B8IXZ9_METNO|nr:hypothetical protein [Methylobacterium nodulans]ACL63289.1 hypothetical protein Mnod_7695 [Methylobacterium nodulans ORS 2060]